MHLISFLIREVVVLLLLFRSQGVPPLTQDLGHGAVVLVRVLLVHQRPVPLAEDHEGVHWPPDPRLDPRLPRCLLEHLVVRQGEVAQVDGGFLVTRIVVAVAVAIVIAVIATVLSEVVVLPSRILEMSSRFSLWLMTAPSTDSAAAAAAAAATVTAPSISVAAVLSVEPSDDGAAGVVFLLSRGQERHERVPRVDRRAGLVVAGAAAVSIDEYPVAPVESDLRRRRGCSDNRRGGRELLLHPGGS